MCIECGCGENSIGSMVGMSSVNVMDVSNGQMAEGMVDLD